MLQGVPPSSRYLVDAVLRELLTWARDLGGPRDLQFERGGLGAAAEPTRPAKLPIQTLPIPG
jgi:hypothetical protein